MPPSPSIAILVPSYNNQGTLETVLRDAADSGFPVVVVDDASTDGGAEIIARLIEEGVVTASFRNPRNLGKAGAMKRGFELCRNHGFTHVITCDSDGQHDTGMIRPFANCAERNPDMYLLGCRFPLHPSQPRRNLLGRTLSNVAIRAHCGVAVGDAACGFRCWPLELPLDVHGISGRYAWEEEMITRAAWAGWRIGSLDIPAIYHPPTTRISHYRFRRDWTEGIAIFLLLLLEALLPWPRIRRGPWWGGIAGRGRSLLFPARMFGFRPEHRTEIWFTGCALVMAIATLLFAPIGWPTIAIASWIGWRWHAGLTAIGIAVAPSLIAQFGILPGLSPLAVGITTWIISFGFRPGSQAVPREVRGEATCPTLSGEDFPGSESPADAGAEQEVSPPA